MWSSYYTWLNAQVAAFVTTQVGTVAGLLAPVLVTLATIYVMLWGWLQLTGKIQEPILEGAKRIFTIAAILLFTIQLATNLGPILDVFVNGPQAVAAGLLAGMPATGFPPTTTGAVDAVWMQGATVGDNLLAAGTIWDSAGLTYIGVGLIVYVVVGLATLYVAFLMTLALVALGIILALGPIFIGLVFFDSTKRFFEAWIAQLANYSIVIILTATAANFMLRTIRPPLLSAVASGAAITAAEGLRLAVFCIFMFLLLRQVLPMAAGLASGIALSTGNVVSGAISWGLGRTRNVGRGVWDAMTGQGTTRWDPGSRKAGYWTAHGVGATAVALWRLRPGARNTIRPRTSDRAGIRGADVPPSARK